jgi:outer membrane protein OmpA-like peptidoglycan-associated protein
VCSSDLWSYDADNQQVFLRENINNYTENQSILFLDIPVKLGFEYSLSPRIDVYLNLGITYGLAIQNHYNNSGLLTRTGYYPIYNALLYDIDVPGSPYFYPTDKAMSGSGEFNKQNNISFEGALGLKYKLNQKWSVFGGLKIMNGFQSIKSGEGMMIQNDPLNYKLNSIMNRNDKVTTQAIGAEFGISLNLGKCKKAPVEAADEVIEPIVLNEDVKNTVVDTIKSEVQPDKQIDANISLIDSKTGKPVKATIELKENGKIVKTINCGDNGQAIITVTENKNYAINVTADGYLYHYDKFDFADISNNPKKEYSLDPIVKKETNIEQRPITFQSGLENISPENAETLNIIINKLKENPEMQIEISGHTDKIGNEASNTRLSIKRAQAIADYLVSKGVDSKQLKPIGYGSTKPIADNTTEEGRSKNRRVEFKVLNQ